MLKLPLKARHPKVYVFLLLYFTITRSTRNFYIFVISSFYCHSKKPSFNINKQIKIAFVPFIFFCTIFRIFFSSLLCCPERSFARCMSFEKFHMAWWVDGFLRNIDQDYPNLFPLTDWILKIRRNRTPAAAVNFQLHNFFSISKELDSSAYQH